MESGIRSECLHQYNMQSALKSVIGPNKHIQDLAGRVALVTGGALGIGLVYRSTKLASDFFCPIGTNRVRRYEVSRAFVLNGARVIMVNRKQDQGLEAIEQIKKEAGPDAMIEWLPCDMGNLKQIKETFTKFREQEERLDLVGFGYLNLSSITLILASQLVLSAGINANQYGETTDNIDRHFQVNWLGQFYVCNQLFPLLRKTSKLADTPAPRIVFESSEQHRMAPSDVHFASQEEINNPEVGNLQSYGRTKLAIILGVKYGLLERVIRPNKDNIYALSVHPGAVSNA